MVPQTKSGHVSGKVLEGGLVYSPKKAQPSPAKPSPTRTKQTAAAVQLHHELKPPGLHDHLEEQQQLLGEEKMEGHEFVHNALQIEEEMQVAADIDGDAPEQGWFCGSKLKAFFSIMVFIACVLQICNGKIGLQVLNLNQK